MDESQTPESSPILKSVNVYDRMYNTLLSAGGIDPLSISDFLQEHQPAARVLADATSIGRAALGWVTLDSFDRAVDAGDSFKAGCATAGLTALLATDSIDGYIARTGSVDNFAYGKILDSAMDVSLRFRTEKTMLKIDRHKFRHLIRLGGELAVARHAIPDVMKGEYAATMPGKIKVNFDVAYVLASMARSSLELKDNPPESAIRHLKRIAAASFIGGAALAYGDSFYRGHSKRHTESE